MHQVNDWHGCGHLQAGHHAAATALDSDSDDEEDFEQYSELDAFDTEEVDVSPDDEQALAAFMVRNHLVNAQCRLCTMRMHLSHRVWCLTDTGQWNKVSA